MAADSMLELFGVSRSFGPQQVLNNIDLIVRRGTTRVILGLSGSGKSVLMKHMIGLLRPDSGRILVDGADLAQMDRAALLEVRRKFGMVFQQAALFDSMTVAQNVAFPLREHTHMSNAEIARLVDEKLTLVGLADKAGKETSEISGGMKKRVALARAIVLSPACVFYDEPTTGLDPITTEYVDEMILAAKKELKVTSVVISHDVGSALKVADDVAVIHEGRIVEDCPASEVRSSKHPFVQQFLRTWFGKQE